MLHSHYWASRKGAGLKKALPAKDQPERSFLVGNAAKRTSILTLFIGVIFTMVFFQSFAQQYGVLGKPAPSWSVEKWINLPPDKKSLDIQDFQGKVLYLYCFQSWCPGCHSHGFPTLQKMIERFSGQKDVAFVAIQTVFEGFSSNTFEHAKQTAEKYKTYHPLWAKWRKR